MDAAEVDVEAWKVLSGHGTFDSGCQFPDADGPVVVDAGLFGGLQFGFGTVLEPLSRNGFIAKSNSPDGTGRVTVFADLAARRIGTQQAA